METPLAQLSNDLHRDSAVSNSSSPDSSTRIAVVVPVLNAIRFLSQAIPQILAAARNTQGVTVLCVDNGSTDGSLEYLRSLQGDGIRVQSLKRAPNEARRNLSAAARNFGAQRTHGEFLSFLDADCLVANNYFDAALAVLESTGAAATGCETEIPSDPHWIEATWHDLHYVGRERDVHYLNSANFFISRHAFEDVGGFRDDLPSGADAEIGQRLTNAGYRIYESPAVGAVHLGNPKSVREFYRRSVWHGGGMLGTADWNHIDKPIAMMGLHLIATIIGLLVLAVSPFSLFVRLGIVVLLQLGIPGITVAYRGLQTGHGKHLLEGIVLYWLYYWARVQALLLLVVGRSHKYAK